MLTLVPVNSWVLRAPKVDWRANTERERIHSAFHACSLLLVLQDEGRGSGLSGWLWRAASGYEGELNQDPFYFYTSPHPFQDTPTHLNPYSFLLLAMKTCGIPRFQTSLLHGTFALSTQIKGLCLEEDRNLRQDFKSLIHREPATWNLAHAEMASPQPPGGLLWPWNPEIQRVHPLPVFEKHGCSLLLHSDSEISLTYHKLLQWLAGFRYLSFT